MPTGKLIIIDSKVYVMCKLDVIPHLTLSDAVSITQIQLYVILHQHTTCSFGWWLMAGADLF
jgi:hypothetical protein